MKMQLHQNAYKYRIQRKCFKRGNQLSWNEYPSQGPLTQLTMWNTQDTEYDKKWLNQRS